MPSVPINLATLPAHSIFSSGGKEKDDWEIVDSPNDDLVGTKSSRLILRDKDLIVASGAEIRMCSLAGDAWKVDSGTVGTYKTLKSECLNFPVESLVLNPTERLLAVVGKKQVAVIALPTLRIGEEAIGNLECRAFAIDEFEYSSGSQVVITKALWHPLGEGGESLWILTSDGRLHEYDIRRPDDPTQSFTFLAQASSASSSKFTAIDPLSRHATSFAFTPYSPSTFDFSPFTVTVLIANGDVYTMNPILPLRAELPLRYLQGLKAYVKQRRRKAEEGRDELGIDQADSWDLWVGDLVKQYREGSKIDESPNKPMKRSSSMALDDDGRESVKVHPPHLTSTGGPASGSHKALLRQGPVIFTPAPQEADEDEETYASDIAILKVPTHDGDDEGDSAREEIRVLSIAWSSSRVDIGLYTEVSEPVWVENDAIQQTNPTIPILESVYLGEASSIEPVVAPSFGPDAIYADTFHIRHSQGLSSINTRSLLDSVLHGGNDDVGSSVSSLVSTDGSQAQAIVGSTAFCNISLGYGVLALTASSQLASSELDFRANEHTIAAIISTTQDSTSQPSTDERSFLSKQPDVSTLIDGTVSYTKYTPPNIRGNKDLRGPVENITAAHLKLLGEVTSEIRKRTEAIRAASQKVENRLDLQVREYQRQVKLLKSARGEMKTLSGDDAERVSGIAKKQRELGERLDRVLSSAMASHKGPDVSESERKWFDELEKLHTKVGGLSTRFSQMGQQVEKAKSEPKSTPKPVEAPENDAGDIKPIKTQVDAESEEIRKMLRKMDRLSVRVEAAMIEGEESD